MTTIARTQTSSITILRETRSDLERREITPNSDRHEYRVSGGAWMSAPELVTALGLDECVASQLEAEGNEITCGCDACEPARLHLA